MKKIDTEQKINDFYDFIAKYPFLGLQHEIGKEIEQEIKSICPKIIRNETWYRAKAPDGYKIFSKEDMLPPLPENTREGRYNHYGLPVLYLSENEKTCAAEISKELCPEILCWIQKFSVNDAKIIDLTFKNQKEMPMVFASLIKTDTISINNLENRKYYKPEYRITRFISDLCRLNGIDGIKYSSAIYEDENGCPYSNLVIFDTKGKFFSFEGEPYIYK